MYEIRYDDRYNFRDDMMKILCSRRNLMVYEGIRDGLEENIDYRFFYSSPGEALEFVIIDIYRYPIDIEFESRKMECFGKIKMIREPGDFSEEAIRCLFGRILIENIKLREMDKINIVLNLNFHGIERIEEAIEYFEGLFCVKDNN